MLADARAMAAADWLPMEMARRNSIALRLFLVASGAFDAMASVSRLQEWDMAAGDLIAGLAGAVVTDRHGLDLAFNCVIPSSRGLICANASLHSLIQERLGAICGFAAVG